MIEFSVCRHCGKPIFYDWKGAHHVDLDNPCPNPEEAPEED
jgi:hypothetical protein